MVLGQQALHTNVGGTEVMAGQLEHLLTVLRLPRLRLGIIPFDAPYRVPLNNGFWILDEALVQFDTYSAELSLVKPDEIALYGRAFERLAALAVYGAEARAILHRTLDRLTAKSSGANLSKSLGPESAGPYRPDHAMRGFWPGQRHARPRLGAPPSYCSHDCLRPSRRPGISSVMSSLSLTAGPASGPRSAWEFESALAIGALPTATPCARLHARNIACEWGLHALADTIELVVSELVTNAVKASADRDHRGSSKSA